jgi:hypothetical protein
MNIRPDTGGVGQRGPELPVLGLGKAPYWLHGMGATLHGTAVVLLYAALAFVLFYPLFRDPAHTVRDESLAGPDTQLNIWALAWVWHALTTDPASLFNGNIFYPAPYALCGSEHMLGHQLIFGPIYALSGNPVLGHQLNLLLSFAFSGAAMYVLLLHWRVSVMAALFGGFVYAFCPIRSYGMEHAQLLAIQYLPLALLCLDRTLLTGRPRWAAGFGLCLTVQMLTSYYVAYMSLTALFGYGVGVLWSSRVALRPRGVVVAVVAVLVACLVLTAVSFPYLHLRDIGVIPDFATEEPGWLVRVSSGMWRNYLLPPIALREWGQKPPTGVWSYVGLVPLVLALVGLGPRRAVPEGAERWAPFAALGVALACYVLSLGPEVHIFGRSVPLPYALAVRWIPGFSSMRVPSRFALILMLGLAALSGLGLNRVLGLIRPSAAWRPAGSLLLVVLSFATAVEYDLLHHDFGLRHLRVGPFLPPVYRALAELPRGPVLEVPGGALHGEIERLLSESEAMLYSTFHWQALLNGYTGHPPRSYTAVMTLARQLPEPVAARLLARLTGLRYVVVHGARLADKEKVRWQQAKPFALLKSFGQDLLFTFQDRPPADLLPRLIDFDQQKETVLGTPLAQLPESERRAEISLVRAAPMVVGTTLMALGIELQIANRSRTTWPALAAVRDEEVVTVAYRFESEDGSLLSQELTAARLPYDLAPGDSLRVALRVLLPRRGLPRRLLIGLAQNGTWFPDRLGPLPVNVTPQ